MRKTAGCLLFAAFFLLFFEVAHAAQDNLVKMVEQHPAARKFLATIGGRVHQVQDIGDLYEIVVYNKKGTPSVMYLTKDRKYLVVGMLLDENVQNLTARRAAEFGK